MTSHETVLEWPSGPITIDIPIGNLEETEVNPDHVKYHTNNEEEATK